MSTHPDAPGVVARALVPLPGAAPSRPAMLSWLCSDSVVLPDGGVLSWSNPSHPGYRYAEAAALVLNCLNREGAGNGTAGRVARQLLSDMAPNGGYGKNGALYLFDSAVVLQALLRYIQAGGRSADPAALRRIFGFVSDSLARRAASLGDSRAASGHWSASFGCHLLKVAPVMIDYARWATPDSGAGTQRLVHQLIESLVPLASCGRFRIYAGSNVTYLHAHCYAVEGLLELRERGMFCDDALLLRCARWLADVQRPAGGLPAWHDGTMAAGECRGDATAQAIQIWRRVAPVTFAGNVTRGLAFLRGLQSASGGLHYQPGSEDVNTWVTVFAIGSM